MSTPPTPSPSVLPPLHIHYHRPPDRRQIFRQFLLLDTPTLQVSFAPTTPLAAPLEVDGTVILEPGAPVVWFTFPGVWHDIGRFHDATGTFTGWYANILTPPRLNPGVWSTVDLFLDVWLPAGSEHSPEAIRLLDEDELEEALRRGWISPRLHTRARLEARTILTMARGEAWPPPEVHDWTLERCRSVLDGAGLSEGGWPSAHPADGA